MKDNPSSSDNEKIPPDLTVYKPEEELFQRLPLCTYLSELPEIDEAEGEKPDMEKKD